MKNFIFFFLLIFSSMTLSAQILTNSIPSNAIQGSNAFMDLSTYYSSAGFANNNYNKGLVFPDVDLTTFIFETTVADGFTFPSFYDGMVVYNTATGNTSTAGSNPTQSIEVTPGFYYFSNPNGSSNFDYSSGEWKPLGSEGSPKIHITENTPTETNLVTANTATEKVISITGTADGITTHMDLGTTVLPKDTVVNFRKAIICDSNGTQVLVATGSYDSATNKFVTGNGMMNYCLPAANDYKVELYFTSN
jgi:hypothetical protein